MNRLTFSSWPCWGHIRYWASLAKLLCLRLGCMSFIYLHSELAHLLSDSFHPWCWVPWSYIQSIPPEAYWVNSTYFNKSEFKIETFHLVQKQYQQFGVPLVDLAATNFRPSILEMRFRSLMATAFK